MTQIITKAKRVSLKWHKELRRGGSNVQSETTVYEAKHGPWIAKNERRHALWRDGLAYLMSRRGMTKISAELPPWTASQCLLLLHRVGMLQRNL